MSLDDLVFDQDLSPDHRMNDIESALHLMLLAPSRRDLFTFRVERLSRAVQRAQPNLALVKERFSSHESADLYWALFDSFNNMADAVGELAGSLPAGKSPYWLIEAVKAEIEASSQALLASSASLNQVFDVTASNLKTEQWTLWQTAMKVLDNAISDYGLERQELYRDARTHLNDLITMPSVHPTAAMWLLFAWLSWKRRLNLDDVAPLFENALKASQTARNVVHWLAARHLAHIHSETGYYLEAFETIKLALLAKTDGQTLFEAYTIALRAGRQSDALAFAKRCIQLSPLHAIPLLAFLEVEW